MIEKGSWRAPLHGISNGMKRWEDGDICPDEVIPISELVRLPFETERPDEVRISVDAETILAVDVVDVGYAKP